MQGIWSRFTPVYQQVRKELSEKTLGTIKLLRAEMCLSVLEVERLQKLELGGGGLENFGIYPVALACMVFGEMPESIKAVGNITPTGEYLVEIRILSYTDNTLSGTRWYMQEKSSVFLQRNTAKLQWLEHLWDPGNLF